MHQIPASPRVHLTAYRMFLLAAIGLVVGTVSSFATIGFIELVRQLHQYIFVTVVSKAGFGASTQTIVTILSVSIGGLIVGLLLHYGVKSRQPLGVPDAIYAVQLREKLPDPKSGFFSTLASIVSLSCGASVGQYGPVVYLGSIIGQLTNRMNLGVRDIRSIAIACGVAAAISTAFNAPIAGLIFTHEVLLRHYSLRILTAVTVASACGFIVDNVVFDNPPLFLIEFDRVKNVSEYLLFALEGIGCGLIAVVFMRLLQATTRYARALKIPAPLKPMLAGFMLSLVALQIPEVLGVGQDVLRLASIGGNFDSSQLATILLGKFFVTIICIGFGFAGGVIFPALLIGVLFGSLFAISIPALLLEQYSGLSVYAISGMVALASPVIGAPLTALLIIFELTRNYEITIAAMIAVVFSNLVSYQLYGRSLFDAQLAERDLDLSLGRDRGYLQNLPASRFAMQGLPCIKGNGTCGALIQRFKTDGFQAAAIIDANDGYLGLATLDQLLQSNGDNLLSSLEFKPSLLFDETTSLWHAMEALREYRGEAVPVVDSTNNRYLGALPESVVIGAYLDAVQDLRREEHQA
ncbi:MAG: CIC family chloride channel protein [Gammaproteobacteria bacterium]|jgi:CIC family chloride channel protein